jgi:hypothetical protein
MPARSMSQMRGISLLAGPNVQITCESERGREVWEEKEAREGK